MSLNRRNFLHLASSSALLLPLAAALKSTGCAHKSYDVEVTVRAARSGSVLDITLEEISGVQSDWNKFKLNGQDIQSKFVYSIRNMWADWIFEVNGNRIHQNVTDCRVGPGDVIVWKGNFA